MAAWRYKKFNVSSCVVKIIFHLFATLTHEIFFNSQREISYLHAAMYTVISSIYLINTCKCEITGQALSYYFFTLCLFYVNVYST